MVSDEASDPAWVIVLLKIFVHQLVRYQPVGPDEIKPKNHQVPLASLSLPNKLGDHLPPQICLLRRYSVSNEATALKNIFLLHTEQ